MPFPSSFTLALAAKCATSLASEETATPSTRKDVHPKNLPLVSPINPIIDLVKGVVTMRNTLRARLRTMKAVSLYNSKCLLLTLMCGATGIIIRSLCPIQALSILQGHRKSRSRIPRSTGLSRVKRRANNSSSTTQRCWHSRSEKICGAFTSTVWTTSPRLKARCSARHCSLSSSMTSIKRSHQLLRLISRG